MYIRDEVGFVTHLQRWRVKCCTATEMRFVNWSNPPDVLTSWKTWRVRSMMQSITGGIVSQLLQQWQEWERQIPLFIKAKQLVYLFTNEWFLLTYVKECDKICIQTTSLAPKTRRQGLPLSWWGRRFSIWSNLSPTLGRWDGDWVGDWGVRSIWVFPPISKKSVTSWKTWHVRSTMKSITGRIVSSSMPWMPT